MSRRSWRPGHASWQILAEAEETADAMTGKTRFIFPIVMAFMMAFFVSAVITVVNLGFAPDFLSRWMRAFAIAWPSAAFVAFFALPAARAVTAAIVARIGE